MKDSVFENILDGLMRRYRDRVPDVTAIVEAMIREGIITSADDIENDHIAFRSLGVPQLGIRSLEKIFLHFGFQRRDFYQFPAKKLDAFWYAPPQRDWPRVFISELRVHELAAQSQRIIHSYTDEVADDPINLLSLDRWEEVDEFLHRPLWRLPAIQDYRSLLQQSEYAAWVIYNRSYLNHFTISVHDLPDGYNTIADFNLFLERSGFRLNDSGGKIKQSNDGLLLQSSTVAQVTRAEFDDGRGGRVVEPIAGSYVEFAERRPLGDALGPDGRPLRREGFEAASADRIFESTDTQQTRRR